MRALPYDGENGKLISGALTYMSYAPSAAAICVAAAATYENLAGSEIMPDMAGPVLAGGIVAVSFAYAVSSSRKRGALVTKNAGPPSDKAGTRL